MERLTCCLLLPAAAAIYLPHRMLSGDEFIRRVVPSLSRLFASSDRNLRRNLLESIDTYGQHLTTVSCSSSSSRARAMFSLLPVLLPQQQGYCSCLLWLVGALHQASDESYGKSDACIGELTLLIRFCSCTCYIAGRRT
jgi:hypothetical protein